MSDNDHSATLWRVPAVEVPAETLDHWQRLANLIARACAVPAALVMRLADEDIEVFVASHGSGNPYHVGDREHFWGSGLYCEHVIRNKKPLLVPDAEADPTWRANPDVKLGMTAYFGCPIRNPDGTPFGTLCVLDRGPNSFQQDIRKLMLEFGRVLEAHLELVHANNTLGTENHRLSEFVKEIQLLRGIVPICSYCHRVRDDEGFWQGVEEYIHQIAGTEFSHSICTSCLTEHYPEFARRHLAIEK